MAGCARRNSTAAPHTKGQEQAYRTVDLRTLTSAQGQATANRILTVLKAALNYAKTESRRIATDAAWVDVKPFSKVDVPKVRFLSTRRSDRCSRQMRT